MGENEPTLPLDLIIAILERLPVKTLVRFRCVSKSWCTLIKSPYFVNNHLLRTKESGRMMLIRHCPLTPDHGRDDVLSLHDFRSIEQLSPNLSIPVPEEFWLQRKLSFKHDKCFSPKAVHILGCNGLVCINYHDHVLLCNPSLREFKRLPSVCFNKARYRSNSISGVGFGFDSCTDAFKIVLIRILMEEMGDQIIKTAVVHLYNTSTNSWKEIDSNKGIVMDPFSHNPIEVFFNGVCHWPAFELNTSSEGKILRFDIRSEVFIENLEYPMGLIIDNVADLNLTFLSECLTMLKYERFHEEKPCDIVVWAMKEYGVRSSWIKQFVISPGEFTRSLAWNADGFLLLEVYDRGWSRLGIYNNQLRNLKIYGKQANFRGLVYEESLLSLDQVINP